MRFVSVSLLATAVLSQGLLEFDPPTLAVKDGVMDTKFRIRLKEKPSTDVTVFLEAPGINFENCAVVIPASGYNNFVDVPVRPAPVFTDRTSDDFVIKAKVNTADHAYDSTTQVYKATRTYSKGGVCSSIGDPHFTLFDGFTGDFQGKGTYYLFKHKDLVIQTTQGDCNPGTTCNHAIAVRYGSTVLALDTRGEYKVSGLREVTPNKDGVQYVAPTSNDSGRVHSIKVPGGTTIDLVQNWNDKIHWIDFTLHLANGYTDYGGLCNQIAPKAPETLHCQDGADVARAQSEKFFSGWVVSDADNLLNGGYKLNAPALSNVYNKCTLPAHPIAPVKPLPPAPLPTYAAPKYTREAPQLQTTVVTSYVVSTTAAPATTTGTATVAPQVQTYAVPITVTQAVQPVATPPPKNPEFEKQCQSHCQKIFDVPGCKSIVDPSNFIKSCVADSVLSGNLFMAEAMKSAYLAQCNTATQYMKNDIKPQVVEQAQSIRKECGLGNNKCINNCSGNGACGGNGCVCNSGFGGLDCSVNLNKLISYNPQSNSYAQGGTNYGNHVAQVQPAQDQPSQEDQPAPSSQNLAQTQDDQAAPQQASPQNDQDCNEPVPTPASYGQDLSPTTTALPAPQGYNMNSPILNGAPALTGVLGMIVLLWL